VPSERVKKGYADVNGMSRPLLKKGERVARLEPVGSGCRILEGSNAMKKTTTSAAVMPSVLIEEAVDEVRASFERLCLTAGLATLSG